MGVFTSEEVNGCGPNAVNPKKAMRDESYVG